MRIHAGPVFALARIQFNIFEELFLCIFAKFWGEFVSVRIHAAPVLHPHEYRKNILAHYFCIGFVPGGIAIPQTLIHASL